jgi:hypothetical protein
LSLYSSAALQLLRLPESIRLFERFVVKKKKAAGSASYPIFAHYWQCERLPRASLVVVVVVVIIHHHHPDAVVALLLVLVVCSGF